LALTKQADEPRDRPTHTIALLPVAQSTTPADWSPAVEPVAGQPPAPETTDWSRPDSLLPMAPISRLVGQPLVPRLEPILVANIPAVPSRSGPLPE